MLKVNYYIISFGDAAAYRVYVYMLYPLQGGRSTGYSQSTHLPATDTTYTHTHDMLPHHRKI